MRTRSYATRQATRKILTVSALCLLVLVSTAAVRLSFEPAKVSGKVVYRFTGSQDGNFPITSLVSDTSGNLYGELYTGNNTAGAGAIFELDSKTKAETVLYSFCSKIPCSDGAGPDGPLTLDSANNIYGVTSYGGAHGAGTIFELNPITRELRTLWSFTPGGGGQPPIGQVALDAAGNIYGTTAAGGAYGEGTIFVFNRALKKETVLWNFCSMNNCADGEEPAGGVYRDPAGDLFVTTIYGGSSGDGTVFELSAAGQPAVLHAFTGGSDGGNSVTAVVPDSSGNLYGTTSDTVFQLTPTYSVIYNFNGGFGSYFNNPMLDSSGNLWATLSSGGTNPTGGNLFRLTKSGGSWSETFAYSFNGKTDGGDPPGALCCNLGRPPFYGTTEYGGVLGCSNGEGCGTIFQVTE